MNASYDYFFVEQAVGNLAIDDIGNCCVQANNDLGEFYYLCIQTDYGITKILEYGPYIDFVTPQFVNYNFQQFNYNESRIDKIINNFLNNGKRNISQAILVEFKDIKDKLINLVEFIED